MPYWSMTFPGHAEILSDLRRFTMKVLGDAPGADAVELVASELACNAIQHSRSGQPGGRFTLHLAAFMDCWLVRVDDAGGLSEPCICDADTDLDESGHGLAMVAAVSSKWGSAGDVFARAVWAEIPMPEKCPERVVPAGLDFQVLDP